MEYTIYKQAIEQMKKAAERSDAVLVAFSGGKDSLVCLDLAVKCFPRVVPFHMFLVPGLSVVEKRLSFARERYGLDVLQYPGFLLFEAYRNEVYCPSHYRTFAKIGKIGLKDIFRAVMADTGIRLLITAAKKSDSLWRRQKYFKFYAMDEALFPLADWRKKDVIDYLRRAEIPLPEASAGGSTGIDLSTPSLLWLHDNHPADFARLLEYFPYAGAAVKRRDWHGIA